MIKAKLVKNLFGVLAQKLQPRKDRIIEETKRDIVRDARRIVTVDTGELQRSIRPTLTGVEAGADHAAAEEYGQPPHRPPRPFLTPAAEMHRRRMLRRLANELFDESD